MDAWMPPPIHPSNGWMDKWIDASHPWMDGWTKNRKLYFEKLNKSSNINRSEKEELHCVKMKNEKAPVCPGLQINILSMIDPARIQIRNNMSYEYYEK